MNTKVNLFGNVMDNPVIAASGTFGFGYEFADYYDINVLGSISLKGTTLESRYGNPLPRIAECPAGLINAIGLQNPGVDKVIAEELPKLSKVYKKPVIANVGGHSEYEYEKTAEKFNAAKNVFALELNISCPNIKGGGMAFGTDAAVVENLVKKVKAVSEKPVIVKLSPNVTDVVSLAKAAENGGADGLSLINTLLGMRIDISTRKTVISTQKGGYSGPGLFPVAVRMVYEVSSAVKIPVIGMGGISDAEGVVEMMTAGAAAVMVGSANLINPRACADIINDLPRVMKKYKINNLTDVVGSAHNG